MEAFGRLRVGLSDRPQEGPTWDIMRLVRSVRRTRLRARTNKLRFRVGIPIELEKN